MSNTNVDDDDTLTTAEVLWYTVVSIFLCCIVLFFYTMLEKQEYNTKLDIATCIDDGYEVVVDDGLVVPSENIKNLDDFCNNYTLDEKNDELRVLYFKHN